MKTVTAIFQIFVDVVVVVVVVKKRLEGLVGNIYSLANGGLTAGEKLCIMHEICSNSSS